MSDAPLFVEAMGAHTCLGPMSTSAAAHRAGIARARQMPEYPLGDGALTGCVAPHAESFEGYGRVARLLSIAIEDLIAQAPAPLRPNELGLLVVVPDLAPDEEPDARSAMASAAVRRALELASLPLPEASLRVIVGDADDSYRALEEAGAWCDSGRFSRCIVGAADTLLDPERLRRLFFDGRLKGPEQPHGAIPGEAAALTLVARSPRGRPLARLTGPFLEEEITTDDQPSTGAAATEAMLRAIRVGAEEPPSRVVCFSDLTGDSEAAQEFGNSLVRVVENVGNIDAWSFEYPCASFGAVGSAFLPMAIGLAARSWLRGYGAASHAIAVSTSSERARAALRIERA